MVENRTFSFQDVKSMRTELLQWKKERNHYKLLYAATCREKKVLNSKLLAMSNERKILKHEIEVLKTQKKNLVLSKGRKRKCPFLSFTTRTIHNRIDDCKALFEPAMKKVPGMVKCDFSLRNGDTEMKFSLPSIPQAQNSDEVLSTKNTAADHSYCMQENVDKSQEPEEHLPRSQQDTTYHIAADHSYSGQENVDTSVQGTVRRNSSQAHSIYDDEGNFTNRHIRKAVLVTDNYRISHEAYHEIRSELCGHMPPIGKLKIEKAVMSEEIPYFKHRTVSSLLSLIFLFWDNTKAEHDS